MTSIDKICDALYKTGNKWHLKWVFDILVRSTLLTLIYYFKFRYLDVCIRLLLQCRPHNPKVSFIILRHYRTHWPCWLRTWGGESSLTKTPISQSALCAFASAFTLVTLALCVKCWRTLKGTLHFKIWPFVYKTVSCFSRSVILRNWTLKLPFPIVLDMTGCRKCIIFCGKMFEISQNYIEVMRYIKKKQISKPTDELFFTPVPTCPYLKIVGLCDFLPVLLECITYWINVMAPFFLVFLKAKPHNSPNPWIFMLNHGFKWLLFIF